MDQINAPGGESNVGADIAEVGAESSRAVATNGDHAGDGRRIGWLRAALISMAATTAMFASMRAWNRAASWGRGCPLRQC